MSIKTFVPILLTSLLILVAGCSSDTKASLTGFAFGGYVDLVCSDARFQKEQYDEFFQDSSPEFKIKLEAEIRSAEKKCVALSAVWETVAETHGQLRDGVYSPTTVYLFDFDAPEGGSPIPVGFYDSSSSCGKARDALQAAGYRSKDCYERTLFWKTVWE